MRRGTDIDRAADVLARGGLVAFPTETVYGLGADASSAEAVGRIYAAKGRPADHPLIVHLADGDDLARWAAHVPASARVLAARFWPGPLTIILRRGPAISASVTAGGDTVGLRMPAHPIAQALIARFAGAIAAPSANRHGHVSPTTADHVAADLGDALDYLLDGGACEVGVESTIVDLSGGLPALLRPGGVDAREIEEALGVTLAAPGVTSPRAPGSLASHYAPRTRVIAIDRRDLDAALRAPGKLAVLAPSSALIGVDTGDAHVVALPDDLEESARRLYAALRELDAAGVDLIIAVLPPETGLGAAIADRLRRAAGPRLP
jgi:L-threonylcarbamoyladenylate synthase